MSKDPVNLASMKELYVTPEVLKEVSSNTFGGMLLRYAGVLKK